MHKHVMRKFVKALRSGEYVQIVSTLVEPGAGPKKACDGFCALGVLTDVYVLETGDFDGAWFDSQDEADFYHRRVAEGADPDTVFDGRTSLTPVVQEWAGMIDRGASEIITMNDADALSFRKIADRVERDYEDL